VQRGRGRAREMLVVGFALLTCGAHAAALREARAEDARIAGLRVRGDHSVRASAAAGELELGLKNGFSALLREAPRSSVLNAGADGLVALRVAGRRAAAAEIAASFVPIGPTVELTVRSGRADVAFRADHFRVRSGHRLVLAVEQPGCADPTREACHHWRLAAASYEAGRCLARGVQPAGLRLQFGSLAAE
jgi:hypothetical protein